MKSEKINAEDVPAGYLAEVLSLTTVRISQLHTTGVIPNNGTRGRYSLFDAVPAYRDYILANKGDDAAMRLTRARATKVELENARRESELVRTSEAVEVFAVASTHWKSIADALPKRIAKRLAKIKNPDEVRMILRAELDGIYSEFEKGLQYLESGN